MSDLIDSGFEEEIFSEEELDDVKTLYGMVYAGRAIERMLGEITQLKLQLRREQAVNKKWTELAASYDPDGMLKAVLAGMDLADRKLADRKRAEKKAEISTEEE